jgi:hypothetical protein
MGHHMGTDSEDLFVELSSLLPEQHARVSMSFDREVHNQGGDASRGGDAREISMLYELTGNIRLRERVEVMVTGGYGRIENPGNTLGPTIDVYQGGTEVRYQF